MRDTALHRAGTFPRADVVAEALHAVEGQTFCPYKGLAFYYDVGDAHGAAWSYRAPFQEMARVADLMSFEPHKATITIDGEKLDPARGQNVVAHGPDPNLSVDEIGGIEFVELATSAQRRA
jgi:nucleotidyltransferase-like protein